MKIRTNNHWRELHSVSELPAKAREEFDYIDNEEDQHSPRLFRYRGVWYDTGEFFACGVHGEPSVTGWHGVQSDSFFSGVVVRYSDDFEQIQAGTYTV